MPIYEYKCRECDSQFEALVQSAAAAGSTNCPGCGAGEPRRLMSVIAGMGGRSAGSAAAAAPAPTCGSGACARCS